MNINSCLPNLSYVYLSRFEAQYIYITNKSGTQEQRII